MTMFSCTETVPPLETRSMVVKPNGIYVPVGVKITCTGPGAAAALVWEVKVGRESQFASSGHVAVAMFNGKRIFRFTDTHGKTVTVDVFNPSGEPLTAVLELDCELPPPWGSDASVLRPISNPMPLSRVMRGFALAPKMEDQAVAYATRELAVQVGGQGEFEALPQVGGWIRSLLVAPDLLAASPGGWTARLVVHDVGPGMVEIRDTRRTYQIGTELPDNADALGLVIPVNEVVPVWPGERVVVEVHNLAVPGGVASMDLVPMLEVDEKLCDWGPDKPRYRHWLAQKDAPKEEGTPGAGGA